AELCFCSVLRLLPSLGSVFSLILLFFIFFFFSSRRRHTRSKRDWSSDVCSSDLAGRPGGLGRLAFGLFVLGSAGVLGVLVGLRSLALGCLGLVVVFGVRVIIGLRVVVRRAFVVCLGCVA